ncbi:hypothetical protein KA005_05290, partial [bacterium]|nr:hypothetical protein [bacterium]
GLIGPRRVNHLLYIFEPDQANKVLQKYNSIRNTIGDSRQEGKPTKSFPKARKTGREIYRILCSQHYPHLQELLMDINLCLEKGWDQPKLLKTYSETEFDSAVAELMVAAHFVKLGLNVSSFDQKKGQESVPDILVTGNGVSCACEVYAPRDWDGLEYFMEDMRLNILHLDTPWDFHFEIKMSVISHFDNEGKLLYFDPWRFSDAYENPSLRSRKIECWISDVFMELDISNPKEIRKRFNDDSLNVSTGLSINKIQRSQVPTPVRRGLCLLPTLTGYAPEGMFDRLIQRRILAKIGKKQTSGFGDCSALFIDISGLGYPTEFRHSFYRKKFVQSITQHLKPDMIEIDMIMFFYPNRSRETGIEFPILFKKAKIPLDNAQCLLGDGKRMEKLTEEIFVEKTQVQD